MEATGELIGNKIGQRVVKPKPVPASNVEEVVIPPQKSQEILTELSQEL